MRKQFLLTLVASCMLMAATLGTPIGAQDFDESTIAELESRDPGSPLDRPEVTAEGGSSEFLVKTSCSPVFERYPVAGTHNHGYDAYWWSWTCGTANSNSDFYSPGHLGNDIFAGRGTPIVAAQSGTISYSFWDSTGGNVVYIVDGCGWWHYYAHLDTVDPGLWIGQYVMAGARLGTMGNTGSASGTEPHLHYSTFPGTYSQGIDPFPYLYADENTACQSGNPCSCLNGINVDWYSVPVTDTDCGHRVCGISNELWECGTNQSWNKVTGVYCDGACSCPNGRFKNGREIPAHMTHCDYRVCGMNSKYWDCKPWGWYNTGINCN